MPAAAEYPVFSKPQAYRTTLPSRFGDILICWTEEPKAKLQRIFLPRDGNSGDSEARAAFPDAAFRNRASGLPELLTRCAASIETLLSGQPIAAPIELLAESLRALPAFQRRVLVLEATIPFGHISTYGALALAAGLPAGARAAASALSHNPFPLLIPCHRVISASGNLTGYQGGTPMKAELLRQEGIAVEGSRVAISSAIMWHFPSP